MITTALLMSLLAVPDGAVRLLGDLPSHRIQVDRGVVVTFDGAGWRRHAPNGRIAGYRAWAHGAGVIAWSPGFELILSATGRPARYTLHRVGADPVDLGPAGSRTQKGVCTVMGCAATTGSGEVTVWNAEGAAVRAVTGGVSRRPNGRALALSADGRWLALGAHDVLWRVVDVFTGDERARDTSQTAPAQALAFSPDSASLLVRVGWGIAEFDIDTATVKRTRAGITDAFGYDPAGQVVLGARGGRQLDWRDEIRFEGTVKRLPGGHAVEQVVRRSGGGWTAAVDAEGRAWAIPDADGPPLRLPARGAIRAVRWVTDDGPPTLVAVTHDHRLLRWDVARPDVDEVVALGEPARWLAVHRAAVLLAGERAVRLVDGRTGATLARFEHERPIDGVGFNRQHARPWRAIVRGGDINREECPTGVRCGNANYVCSQLIPRYTTWHPTDGLFRTSPVQDGQLWNDLARHAAAGGGAIDAQPPVDKNAPVLVGADGNSVTTRYSAVPLFEQQIPLAGITAFSGFADEEFVVGDQRGQVHHFRRRGHRRFMPRAPWLETSLTPDGQRVAAATNGRVLVLDRRDGRAHWAGTLGASTAAVALSPSGDTLVHVDVDGRARVRALATGKMSDFRIQPPPRGSFVHRRTVARWRGDGGALAVADEAGVTIWRPDGTTRSVPLPGPSVIRSLGWSGDALVAASASRVWWIGADGAARVVYAPKVKPGRMSRSHTIQRAVADPDGRAVIIERNHAPALRVSLSEGEPADCTADTCKAPRSVERTGGYSDKPFVVAGAPALTLLGPREGGWAWTDGARFDCQGGACARVLVDGPDGPSLGPVEARRGWR